jgi:hypothetical protein
MTSYSLQNAMGAIVGVLVIYTVLVLVVFVWYALAFSKVLPRLGGEGWKAWVPILNEAELLVRGGVPAWSVIYYFIPILQFYGLYLKAVALSRVNAQFGYGGGMVAVGILFPPIWASLLAWGRPRTEPVYDERVASMMPTEATGPLASADLPTFPSASQPATVVPPAPDASPVPPAPDAAAMPAASPVPAAPDAAAAPAVIHNPWAPASPADAPTPAVAIPPTIAPPVHEQPVAAPPVAAPPAALPAEAPPAAPVESVLSAPPVASPAEAPAMPAAPEPAPQLAPAPAAAEPEAAAEPVFVPALPPEPEPVPEPAPATVAPPAIAETPDEDDEDDYASTVVVDRRPVVRWALLLDDARSFSLSSDVVEVGRKPEGSDPAVQYLPISDSTRTLSKSHARLLLSDGAWSVVDLNSTNGVVTIGEGEVENLLAAGGTARVDGRFILGKVGMRVVFEEGPIS